MDKIKIMINGLPGNVTTTIAAHALKDPRVFLLPYSLTGPEIEIKQTTIGGTVFELIPPQEREDRLVSLKKQYGDMISVDFTHPSAVNENAALYCRLELPFVMGTTGGDRAALAGQVAASTISAVIAPNMAKQIVGFQAMLAYAAETFPGIFKSYTLAVHESHQAGKADTSGTAKAVVESFNRMGIDFHPSSIVMERNPEIQRERWGIPEAYLSGHGWHSYRLTSADGTVVFEFKHNVNGREIYAEGTIDAACYLDRKCKEGKKGAVYSMIDVLRGWHRVGRA